LNLLRLTNVSVFGDHDPDSAKPLLDGVTLTISPGERLNLVGVNGSGKSTLARLIAGMYSGWKGGVMERGFAGQAAAPIVLQRPESQLFGETPREEVQFALEWRQVPHEQVGARVKQALEAVGLLPYADAGWASLSGGQKQLAAIAAAVASESPLIVFDEATSMLDEINRLKVLKLADTLQRKGTAVVWVTQRLDELKPDDRTIALAEGKIRFDGDGRSFLYGQYGETSPCELCGLRLPYMATLALAWRSAGLLSDPLPVTDEEWQEVLGDGQRAATFG
jgi:energy-coupling factor transporter ATP-binding protein EcfA2